MAEKKPLTPSKINLIAFAARDGTADAEDVRQILDLFYRLASANSPIPPGLIAFVAQSFGRYLRYKDFYGAGERSSDSLDSAFGLLRKKGRPKADEQRRMEMAAAVLRLRLTKITQQNALEAAAKECGSNTATVGEAWQAHWHNAMLIVRRDRDPDLHPWTDDEKRILLVIKRERSKRSRNAPKARTQKKSQN